MPIGKGFRCTTKYGVTCDSAPINVYCRDTYELRADIQARIDANLFYAPFCIVDPLTTLNIEACHKISPNEAIIAIANNTKVGRYHCALYYEGTERFSMDFDAFAGGALCLYVAYRSDEIYQNGTYSFKFTHSDGSVLLDESFTVTGGVSPPPPTGGEIIGVWCNGYPNCASPPVPAGATIGVEARMKNNMDAIGYFRFILKDADTGEVLALNPSSGYHYMPNRWWGEEWHAKLDFKMPAKNLKLDVELWRKT